MKERSLKEKYDKLEKLTAQCHRMKFTDTQMRFLELVMNYTHKCYNIEIEDSYDEGYSKGYQRACEYMDNKNVIDR